MNTLPDVTVTAAGTVTLGRTTYAVEVYTYTYAADVEVNLRSETYLVGPRGARYLLRPFIERHGDTGLREVISMGSGQPLRVRGNVVRVHHVGDQIEVVA